MTRRRIQNKRIRWTLTLAVCLGCHNPTTAPPDWGNINFRQEMRDLVQRLSAHARARHPDFLIIPQNGQELITLNGEAKGPLAEDYLNALDGTGREDLFYGYTGDNIPTPQAQRNSFIAYCGRFKQAGLPVLAIDYCHTPANMDDAYALNQTRGYASFSAPERELNVIPDYPPRPFLVNTTDVSTLTNVRNFLYLINPEHYPSKQDLLNAMAATDYDLIIMDAFLNDAMFTAEEIATLKIKRNGGKRLVVAYLSMGEAESYRYYWQSAWDKHPPDWLEAENPNWAGNYKVRYWDAGWQDLLFGDQEAYLDRLLNAGFDGAYLDLVDAFTYFESSSHSF